MLNDDKIILKVLVQAAWRMVLRNKGKKETVTFMISHLTTAESILQQTGRILFEP